jgi:hypothetical protein
MESGVNVKINGNLKFSLVDAKPFINKLPKFFMRMNYIQNLCKINKYPMVNICSFDIEGKISRNNDLKTNTIPRLNNFWKALRSLLEAPGACRIPLTTHGGPRSASPASVILVQPPSS